MRASLFTRYELGLVKLMPFNLHPLFHLLGALFGLATAWLFKFDKNEKARQAALAFSFFKLGAVIFSKRDRK